MAGTAFYGWAGKILHVDLSKSKIVEEPLSKELAYNFLGGRGFTSKMQFDLLKPGIDPLSPENVLMFSVGPLDGTLSPGSSRWHVAAKSPLTGLIGDGCACGFFGAELKWAGYDLVIIRGRAQKPSYLWINDDDTTLVDATQIWGRFTRETEQLVKEGVGDPDAQVATVGPAAEKLVKYCIVLNEKRSCGRGGMGTVMASKNLKAVAVRGTKGVKVAKPNEFLKVYTEAHNEVRENERRLGGEAEGGISSAQFQMSDTMTYAHGGSPGPYGRNELGILGTRNCQTAVFKDAVQLSSQNLVDQYYVQCKGYLCPRFCPDCLFVVDDGPFYGNSVQFSSSGGFGALIGNNDLEGVLKTHELADEWGMDILTLGPTLSFAMECYEKGILTKKDTDGLDLTWGNMDAVFELIPKIANRDGFGNTLAEGTRGAAKIIGKGAEAYALHVKGLEPPWIDDPRGLQGWGLAYAVASRGGCHMRGAGNNGCFTDMPYSPEGKYKHIIKGERLNSISDSVEMCKFMRGKTRELPFVAKLYSAATGIEMDGSGLELIGDRITTIERLFDVREGFTRKDDTLPKRFLEEPLPEGPAKGHVVHLDQMLDDYYRARGWDINTGIPTMSTLRALGLHNEANELKKLGIISN